MSPLGLELLASLEQKFAKSKAVNFKGTARVRISQLLFLDPIRPIDESIVDALKRDFKAEGCLQHEVDCSVPAIIDNTSLSLGLAKLNISAEVFKASSTDYPAKFEFPGDLQLKCLHGQHRILAAKSYLPPGDRWWLVDIYGEGLNDEARQIFKEGHSYSTNYSDGEIFRQIRVCQFNGDRVGEDRWRARITVNKERDLNKLLKRGPLIKALDSILPMRGLWNHFYLGSMDIFLSLRCDEEIACYINLIQKTWSWILGDKGSHLPYVDYGTVELVQSRAPGISKLDREFLRQNMKLLFPEILEPNGRAEIETRLLSVEVPIPTIYTLFKDLRYLEPAARAVKSLLPKSAKGTLRGNLRFLSRLGTTDGSLVIQESEVSHTTVSGTFHDLFDLAIRQLFLCAIRYFSDPADSATKKEMNPIKQTTNASKRFLGYKLVAFAHQIGFQTEKIDGVLEDPRDILLADMLRSLPKAIFRSHESVPKDLSISFKKHLLDTTVTAHTNLRPAITTVGIGEPLSRRRGRYCGGPLDDNDRPYLFLRNMHAPLSGYRSGGYDISSFYVKRCIYLAFFGQTHIPGTLEPLVGGDTQQATMGADLSGVQEEDVEAPTNGASDGGLNGGSNDIDGTPTDHDEVLRFDSSINGLPQNLTQEIPLQVSFVAKNGDVLGTVPMTRQAVDKQTKEIAGHGFSLMDERGKYWLWEDCYDVLVETETKKLVVVGSIKENNTSTVPDDESGMNKRRGRVRIGNPLLISDLAHKLREEEEEEL